MFAIVDIVSKALTPGKAENPAESQVSMDAMTAELKRGNDSVSLDKASAESSAESQLSSDNGQTITCQENDDKTAKLGPNRPLLGSKQDGDASAEICGMCDKAISLCKNKGTACVSLNCGICDTIYCSGCAEFTPTQISKVLDRADILWSCYQCFSKFEENKLATPLAPALDSDDKHETLLTEMSKISQEMKALSQGMESYKQGNLQSIKSMIESSIQSANASAFPELVAGINGALGHDDKSDSGSESEEEDFPDAMRKVLTKRERRELVRAQREESNSVKLVQAALASQKQDEERQKNIIVYRVPETLSSITEARSKDSETIQKLLGSLGVDSAPVDIRRLGRFNKETVGASPRPVKVTLLDRATRDLAMANTTKLAKVTDTTLKTLTVSYDLSKEQREEQKKLVAEGKELTKNSTTHIWKVRGPPGYMQLKKFPVRTSSQQQHNTQTTENLTIP